VEGGDSPADRFALAELASGRTEQLTGNQSFLRGGGGTVTVTTRRSPARSANGRQHVILHVLAVREAEAVVVPTQPRPAASEARVRDAGRPAPEGVTGLTSRPLLLDRLNLAVARS